MYERTAVLSLYPFFYFSTFCGPCLIVYMYVCGSLYLSPSLSPLYVCVSVCVCVGMHWQLLLILDKRWRKYFRRLLKKLNKFHCQWNKISARKTTTYINGCFISFRLFCFLDWRFSVLHLNIQWSFGIRVSHLNKLIWHGSRRVS